MKVYVAGRWTEKAQVRTVLDALRSRGHAITYDWTEIPDDAPWQAESVKEVEAVRRADALVVVPHTTGRGLWVEVGVALGLGKPVVAYGWRAGQGMDCVFMAHPLVRHAGSLVEVIAYLETL